MRTLFVHKCWLVLSAIFLMPAFAQSPPFYLQKILGQPIDSFPSNWGKPIKASENPQLFEPTRKMKRKPDEIYVYQKEGITLSIGFAKNQADEFSVFKVSPGQDWGDRKTWSEEEINRIININAPNQKWIETLKTTNGVIYINEGQTVTYQIGSDKTQFSMKLHPAATSKHSESASELRPPSP